MEEDCPSKNEDRKLPILNLIVWIGDDNIIMHECCGKSMHGISKTHDEKECKATNNRKGKC